MARPTNAEICERTKEIEPGAEGAIALAQSQYGNSKVVEAEVMKDDLGTITGYEVTLCWPDPMDGSTHVMMVSMDAAMGNLTYEERPNEPPGHAKPKPPKHEKLEKPLKDRLKDKNEKIKAAQAEHAKKNAEAATKEAKVAHPAQK